MLNNSCSEVIAVAVSSKRNGGRSAALKQDPALVAQVARDLVEEQFPLTITPHVLSAVGLDPDLVFRASSMSPVKPEALKRSG